MGEESIRKGGKHMADDAMKYNTLFSRVRSRCIPHPHFERGPTKYFFWKKNLSPESIF